MYGGPASDAAAYEIEDATDYTDRGCPDLSKFTLDQMYSKGDTSLLCLICGRPSANSFVDPVAEAEIKHSPNPYFPEFLFISGTIADPYAARYQGCGEQFDVTTPDPNGPCNDVRASFTNAFGIREIPRLPQYTNTYWFKAYSEVDPSTAISIRTGLVTYERLMQLFAAIQLAGPNLTPDHVAGGDPIDSQSHGAGTYVGMYGWQRKATGSTSPAAGYTAAHHSFLRGMIEEKWDSGPTWEGDCAPQTPYPEVAQDIGCYRMIDDGGWFGGPGVLDDQGNGSWHVSSWPDADDSVSPGPASGDLEGDAGA